MTVIAAILPMAFVGGLMGPYMRPIPLGASAAMIFSPIVAFIVTPWATVRLLRHHTTDDHEAPEGSLTKVYRHVMGALLRVPRLRQAFLASVVVLVGDVAWPSSGSGVETLPFDNKSEFQVIVDMPGERPSSRPTV